MHLRLTAQVVKNYQVSTRTITDTYQEQYSTNKTQLSLSGNLSNT